MTALTLDSTQEAALEILNSTGNPTRQLEPVPLGDGRSWLNADLLNDCHATGTWSHYGEFLATLPLEEVQSGAI